MIAIEANAFVAKRAAKTLQRLDDGTAVALRVELHSLPTLEAVSGHQAVKGLPSGYRSLTLPSGLKNSSLASTVACAPFVSRFRRTRGVLPIVWSIDSA